MLSRGCRPRPRDVDRGYQLVCGALAGVVGYTIFIVVGFRVRAPRVTAVDQIVIYPRGERGRGLEVIIFFFISGAFLCCFLVAAEFKQNRPQLERGRELMFAT